MNENIVDLIFIVDRSGSMVSIKDDVIGGFNSLIEEQRKILTSKDVRITFVQFDDQYEKINDRTPLQFIKNLNNNTFVPRGSTALIDAACRTIDDMGKKYASVDERYRPSKVIVVMITDGHENASQEFSQSDLKSRITHQQDVYKWEFIYIGSNQDAVLEAQKYGITADAAVNFVSNKRSVDKFYSYTSQKLAASSMGGPQVSFSASEKSDIIS